jgi:O-antigen/teichoic acid export membrane protein
MAFGKIYKITIWGAIGQAITNVLLAYLGYSFYSLAWGGVANVFITALAAQFVVPNFGYFRPSLKGWRAIVSFGGKLSISSLANEAGLYAPDMVIGKVLGFTSVGVFSRALGFVSLIEHTLTDALWPVLMPYFSKQNRENRSINAVLINVANGYLAVALPLLGFIALVAYPAIHLLYGAQWDESVPIAQVLCLAMAFKSLNFILGIAIVSLGYAGRVMRAQLVYQSLRITAIIYGSQEGLQNIAMYLVIVEFLGVFVFCSKLRDTDISYLNIFYAFIKNTVLAGFTIFPATIAYIVVNDQVIVDFYNMLNQSLLVTLEAITLKPKTDTQMDELIIIMVTTVVAMIFWMFSIYFIHKEFLSKYVNIRFLKR